MVQETYEVCRNRGIDGNLCLPLKRGEQRIVPKVLGYHGCRKDFAQGVRSGRIALTQWKPSQNVYDWLGEGIYLWETSTTRAHEWAVEQFGNEADVLGVEVDLSQCLNLLEATYHEALRATYRNLRAVYRALGWTLPKNQKKRHDLDCLVINKFVKFMERVAGQEGILFQSVRGVFEEAVPCFPVRRSGANLTFRLRCGTFDACEFSMNGEGNHDRPGDCPGAGEHDPRRRQASFRGADPRLD
jgi:hypothetical protein